MGARVFFAWTPDAAQGPPSYMTDEMSLTKELRVSLAEDDHAFLNAEALGAGSEMQAIVRDLIHAHILAKRREIKVLAAYIQSEGIAAESRRNRRGDSP